MSDGCARGRCRILLNLRLGRSWDWLSARRSWDCLRRLTRGGNLLKDFRSALHVLHKLVELCICLMARYKKKARN